ncbi:MAG: hypothetical protein PHD70_03105 [Anaerostipes sp.]|jgi:hypothetical protein|nr:hypothetical protein [Anaerostipes sp.]MDD3745447.1 hypothetical protein [Anaerostipes sp.]
MSNQNKLYEEVAQSCSEYCPCGCDNSVKNVSNGNDSKGCSCLNCSHFDSNHHCSLDLYDQIVNNI